jgi:hypothetical protein
MLALALSAPVMAVFFVPRRKCVGICRDLVSVRAWRGCIRADTFVGFCRLFVGYLSAFVGFCRLFVGFCRVLCGVGCRGHILVILVLNC